MENEILQKLNSLVMINNIQNLQKWIEIILTSIIGVISGYLIRMVWAENANQLVFLTIAIVFIILFEKLIKFFITTLICKLTCLRMLLLGSHFIEGYWVQKVITSSSEGKTLFSTAIINISFSAMEYKVSGEVYCPTSENLKSIFHSHHTNYSNYSLKYFFEGTTSDCSTNSLSNVVGCTELTFSPNNNQINKYMGTIYDSKNNSPLQIFAEKICQDAMQRFDLSKKEQKIALINQYIKGELGCHKNEEKASRILLSHHSLAANLGSIKLELTPFFS